MTTANEQVWKGTPPNRQLLVLGYHDPAEPLEQGFKSEVPYYREDQPPGKSPYALVIMLVPPIIKYSDKLDLVAALRYAVGVWPRMAVSQVIKKMAIGPSHYQLEDAELVAIPFAWLPLVNEIKGRLNIIGKPSGLAYSARFHVLTDGRLRNPGVVGQLRDLLLEHVEYFFQQGDAMGFIYTPTMDALNLRQPPFNGMVFLRKSDMSNIQRLFVEALAKKGLGEATDEQVAAWISSQQQPVVTPPPTAAPVQHGGVPALPKPKRPKEEPTTTLSWADMVPEGAPDLWSVLNPNPEAVNRPVLSVPIRGVGMEPGQGGGSSSKPAGEPTPRSYDGVDAGEIPFTAPKLVGVSVAQFEYFQLVAAAARSRVVGERGWQFCFSPLSLEQDNPANCFRVVAVNRVVRVFRTVADQQCWYDQTLKVADKPAPVCYLVPADWEAAIRQTWALGEVVGKMGKHLPV